MAKKTKKQEGVTVEQFDKLASLVGSLASSIQAMAEAKTVQPSIVKEVDEAGPDEQPMNPHWRKVVHTVLGKDFDCEVTYPTSGGVLFKVIVPREMSNASQAYFEVHKRDVRTKEIGHTGTEGVKKWCELIKRNLARTRREQIN